MVRIYWQGQALAVNRIVLGRATDAGLAETLRRVAVLRDLIVSTDVVEPRKGDFWIACQPEKGWREVGLGQVGWASGPEAPLAIAILRNAAPVEEFSDAPLISHRSDETNRREFAPVHSAH